MPHTHTQTQSMHFRQGANGKINYQQAKALALHFCWREREKGTRGGVGKEGGGGQEMEGEKTKMKDREVDSEETDRKKSRRRGGKMEEMRERG